MDRLWKQPHQNRPAVGQYLALTLQTTVLRQMGVQVGGRERTCNTRWGAKAHFKLRSTPTACAPTHLG